MVAGNKHLSSMALENHRRDPSAVEGGGGVNHGVSPSVLIQRAEGRGE